MTDQQVNEAAALRAYCRKRIKHIKQRNDVPDCKIKHQERKCTSIIPAEPISDQSVPVRFVGTLKMKTFREEMRKGAQQDFHDPSRCKVCLAKQAEIAMNFFIRNKCSQLQTQLLEEKIESHLYSRDTVCLLGELLQDMPKPSDDPCEIWRRLLKK
ncbi:uncharacterized protein C8orf48-like [Hoplias malabaricus]|uniref:uncharacterized protein C8orf48-like n=1 Tax=Hoplias malabaricus TaxID=27720 RepID=UPI003462ACA1